MGRLTKIVYPEDVICVGEISIQAIKTSGEKIRLTIDAPNEMKIEIKKGEVMKVKSAGGHSRLVAKTCEHDWSRYSWDPDAYCINCKITMGAALAAERQREIKGK
jgi:sRNA-binding carbon storage regulator CsrA